MASPGEMQGLGHDLGGPLIAEFMPAPSVVGTLHCLISVCLPVKPVNRFFVVYFSLEILSEERPKLEDERSCLGWVSDSIMGPKEELRSRQTQRMGECLSY